MAGRIPRDFIDDLIARSDIVEIVDSRVKLKKAGKNYQACCPFHNEKTPSFTVSQDKQFYHCFGCGAHGNIISFVMEYDRLEFVEAVEELARSLGLEVPREASSHPAVTSAQKVQRDDDYQLMEQVTRFFQHQLKHHAKGPAAIDYLKQRGLSGDIVKQWEIGYAPDNWNALLQTFGRDQHSIQQLLDLKLVTQSDKGKQYDFFRNRIMFPIRDKRGRTVGFGGRIIEGDGPKYLNSPETRLFHKGHELFGFYQAKQHNRKLDSAVIVEGYMDVVALSQFGITNATAALGTATTPEHVNMLMRSTDTIICCYDGDRAGREAAWRALENALGSLKDGVTMRFLFLPDGEDPDTMVRKQGKDTFEQLLNAAMPLSQFFFDNLLQRHPVGSAEGKASLKANALPMIAQIPGENQRMMMEEMLSQHTGEYHKFQLNRDVKRAEQQHKKPDLSNKFEPQKARYTPLRTLIRMLIEHPHLAAAEPSVAPELLVDSGISGLPIFIDIHAYCLQNPQANTAQLLEFFRDHPHLTAIGKLLKSENLISEAGAAQAYRDSFTKLLDWMVKSRIDTLLSRSRVNGLNEEEKQELALLIKAQQ